MLGKQRLKLVVHFLEHSFVLHDCKGELCDLLLLLALLHKAGHTAASRQWWAHQWLLLLQLGLQLLQLLDV